MSVDLVLLHAPSIYDFRQKTILYGPVSDLVPSSPVFEMYPIGLTSIAEYLEGAGYRVRIINLAIRMLKDSHFNVEKMIGRLEAPVFGIDLHWMVHCHGSIEVAKLVKKYHPEAKVVFGGLSSSYYYKELIQYPQIDYLIRGDSTEEPFRQLMDCIKDEREPEAVPNLVWRDRHGDIKENPFTHVPADLENLMVNNYGSIIRSVIRYRDLIGYMPFKDWLSYPITAVLTCRGCTQNCIICGGSASAFRHFYHRGKPVFRSPELVAQNLKQIGHFSHGPIFVLGGLDQTREDYTCELLDCIRKSGVKNQLVFELFNPVSTALIRQLGEVAPNFCLEMSPESHDPEIRKIVGRNYSNEAMEKVWSDALKVGCGRLDLFFMIGLPGQTPQSVMENIDYCDYLFQKFKADKRLSLFIAPLSPFIDPGSPGFENPERFGYHILFRSVEEHRQALLSPIWKYSLNYETDWMTRQQIMEVSYEAILCLNRLRLKYGIISRQMAEVGEMRIIAAREMVYRMEELQAKGVLEEELPRLKAEVDKINNFSVSEKLQLELPVGLIKFKVWRTLWYWLTGHW